MLHAIMANAELSSVSGWGIRKCLPALCLGVTDLITALLVFLGATTFAGYSYSHTFFLSYMLAVIAGLGFSRIRGLYTLRIPFWNDLLKSFAAVAIMAAVQGIAVLFAARAEAGLWLLTWAIAVVAFPLIRHLAKRILMRMGVWQIDTIIVGLGEEAVKAVVAISDEPMLGYEIRNFIVSSSSAVSGLEAASVENKNIRVKGKDIPVVRAAPAEIVSLLRATEMPHVIVALSGKESEDEKSMIEWLVMAHTDLSVIPPLPAIALFGAEANHFFSHDILFLRMKNNFNQNVFKGLKRCMDFCAAAAMLILLFPLFACIAVMIWKEDGGAAIFYQDRLGENGKKFRFYKFRSMVRNADEILENWKETEDPWWIKYKNSNFKLDDDPRVLRVGRWIRSSSIDELPQLWNVLRGEMSLVGPRPLLERELDEYGENFHRYYVKTRPGLTGLWQVSGRSSTTFADRIALDAWYVRNWNPWYDIAILFKTIRVVTAKEGAC